MSMHTIFVLSTKIESTLRSNLFIGQDGRFSVMIGPIACQWKLFVKGQLVPVELDYFYTVAVFFFFFLVRSLKQH